MMTAVKEYSKTEAALAHLNTEYRNKIFDVGTTSGLSDAKKVRGEIRGYRTALEETRKTIKEPALRQCQLIDSEAKRIESALFEIERPIDEQIKTEENRKEKERLEKELKEKKRINTIKERIDSIKYLSVDAVGEKSSKIKTFIQQLETTTLVEKDFEEFFNEAIFAREETLVKLKHLAELALNYENEQAELAITREKLEKERKEQEAEISAERARLSILHAEQEEKNRVERERLHVIQLEQERLNAIQAEREQAKKKSRSKKPSRKEIIDVLVKYFNATEKQVTTWLREIGDNI